jgi:hypothetical protein
MLVENAVPVPTEDTACIELIGVAERATTTEPEALEAWVDDEAGCRTWHCKMMWQGASATQHHKQA